MLKNYVSFVKANFAIYIIPYALQGAMVYLAMAGYIKQPNMFASFAVLGLAGYIASYYVLNGRSMLKADSKAPSPGILLRKYGLRLFAVYFTVSMLIAAIVIWFAGFKPNVLTSPSLVIILMSLILSEVLIGIFYGLFGFWILDSFSNVKSPFGSLFSANVRVIGKTIAWTLVIILLLLCVFVAVFFAQEIAAYLLLSETALDRYRHFSWPTFTFIVFVVWDLTVFSFQSMVIATYYKPLYLDKLQAQDPDAAEDAPHQGPEETPQA